LAFAQCTLSINVSIRQLQSEQFADFVGRTLSEYQLPGKRVTLEITESIFIEDYGYLLPVLDDLRHYGCEFSLDDFGTGFSSLSMLRNLPINELKIDKSFTDQLLQSPQDRVMMLNIVNIAKNLGLTVVAEGIETEQQSKTLMDMGCDVQQGYLHARPMSMDDIVALYQTQQQPQQSG